MNIGLFSEDIGLMCLLRKYRALLMGIALFSEIVVLFSTDLGLFPEET